MSFFWPLAQGELQMPGITRHRLCLPRDVGKDCVDFSCRFGVWGRDIGVTCEKRCPQTSHSPLVACKGAGLDKDCHGRKGPRAGIRPLSHKCLTVFLFSVEVPTVRAMCHTDKAEELKFSIHKA